MMRHKGPDSSGASTGPSGEPSREELFLPNPVAVGRIACEHCRTLSLEPAQIDLVARIAPKRGLCIAQPGKNGRA